MKIIPALQAPTGQKSFIKLLSLLVSFAFDRTPAKVGAPDAPGLCLLCQRPACRGILSLRCGVFGVLELGGWHLSKMASRSWGDLSSSVATCHAVETEGLSCKGHGPKWLARTLLAMFTTAAQERPGAGDLAAHQGHRWGAVDGVPHMVSAARLVRSRFFLGLPHTVPTQCRLAVMFDAVGFGCLLSVLLR